MKTLSCYGRAILICFFSILAVGVRAEDRRNLETKTADLLAQMPARSSSQCDLLMAGMAGWGEAGWTLVTGRIAPMGNGGDIAARFAVESLSRYLSQAGREEQRASWEVHCLAALDQAVDVTAKSFFLEQLVYAGSSACLTQLKKYLQHEQLYDPAIRAMLKSGAGMAVPLFSSALEGAVGRPRLALLLALKQSGKSEQAAQVERLAGMTDPVLRRTVLSTLAALGNPSSAPLLEQAARQAGYRNDPAGAVEALLEYARSLGRNNHVESSRKLCRKILKESRLPEQVHYKSKALAILVESSPAQEATALLMKALSDKSRQYRVAALTLAASNPSVIAPCRESLARNRQAEVQVDIIHFLGAQKDYAAVPLLQKLADSHDSAVRVEALLALASILKAEALENTVQHLMKYPSPPDDGAARLALLTICSGEQASRLLTSLKGAPEGAKRILLEVLAAKNDPRFFPVFAENLQATSIVREAAVNSLASAAAPDNIDFLLGVLDGPLAEAEIAPVQKALVAALLRGNPPDNLSRRILEHARENDSMLERYFAVFARAGVPGGIALVMEKYRNGGATIKQIALEALISWANGLSLGSLFEICSSPYPAEDREKAFRGYVRMAARSKAPPDQRLLLLRKIMPLAPDDGARRELLDQLGEVKTFQSFLFATSFFGNDALKIAAANSAVRIALPDPGYEDGLMGQIVREKLLAARDLVSGQDSQYLKIDIDTYLQKMEGGEGFLPMFNGQDLLGWQGFVADPLKKRQMAAGDWTARQAQADLRMRQCWSVKDGAIVFNGKGDNLVSGMEYGDFELLVDWRITPGGDSGIYLRGTPQVQIWDPARTDAGAQVGSGGLYNNQKNASKPLVAADNPLGDWNTFRIRMAGDRVTVFLNGQLVVDEITLENYWNRSIPIFPAGPIELQAHGTDLAFRDIYIREINPPASKLTAEEQKEGFVSLLNGTNLDGWVGNRSSHRAEGELLVIHPGDSSGGNLYTEKEFSDFIFRFDFQLTPGANNGVGIRAPLEGDAAYLGMEIQILDDTAPVYADLKPYQYHGSVYGVIPARRGFLKPVGEWNSEEIAVQGTRIKVGLNGQVIVEGDLAGPRDHGTLDHHEHPGLKRTSGHLGFLGHGSLVKFRNLRIKDLTALGKAGI